MLDGIDLLLRWFIDEIRPRFGDGPAVLGMGKSRRACDYAMTGP